MIADVGEALLIIDFQNDFTPGGALAVREGDTIADRINALATSGRYDLVIATRDWHPADHGSFVARDRFHLRAAAELEDTHVRLQVCLEEIDCRIRKPG